jgi:DNA helicase II / ATP-dependent DNA helicase PcrA
MMEAKYSILWFSPYIDENAIERIHQYIRQGKKVFFLSFDDIDKLLQDELLNEANNKGLFYPYLVRFAEQWSHHSAMHLDGEGIDPSLIEFFDNNSIFNKDQFYLEHNIKTAHLVVKAGAGTGKTTTMINRIMFLKHIDENINLGSVIMITFTNETSLHMRSKLFEKLKAYYDLTKDIKYLEWMEEITSMFIGTIHSFAKEFLTVEGEKLGYSRLMQIRSFRHDQRRLIEKYIDLFSTEQPEIYDSFRFIPQYRIVKSLMEIIEKLNNKSLSEASIESLDYGQDQKGLFHLASYVISHVKSELSKKKKEEQTLEISDLITHLGDLSAIGKDVLKLEINYLFVDEFQDTDESQVTFVVWLVQKYRSLLFAVGDVKQSIYRFRGADYTAFEQLKEQLVELNQTFEEFSLKKNYRSEQPLIHHFNRLFEKWSSQIHKFDFNETDKLKPVVQGSEDKGLVTLSLDDENLKHLLKRLYKQDIAVLVRSNRQVQTMVDKIESLGYFCDATVAGSFYRSLAVREFYLLIRSITHLQIPKDQYLFHQSSYGENEITIATVLNSFSNEKPFILDVLKHYDLDNKGISNGKELAAIEVLQKIIDTIKPHEIYRIRYYQNLRIRFPHENRLMQQEESIAKMKEYKINLERLLFLLKKEFGHFQATIYDFEKFLSIKMATDSIENEWKLESNISHRIKVMTVHKAKGLEFDYVLIPITNSRFIKSGKTDILLIEDNGWKLGYSINWNDDEIKNDHFSNYAVSEKVETVAEEARLLYVALTRAKKGIFVDSNSQMNQRSLESWSDLLESGELLNV